MEQFDFGGVAGRMSSRAALTADTLMDMGEELPAFLANLDTFTRFIAVGALVANGNVPNREQVHELLWHPDMEGHVDMSTWAADVATDEGGLSTVTPFGAMVRHSEHGDVQTEFEFTETPVEAAGELVGEALDAAIYETVNGILAGYELPPILEARLIDSVMSMGLEWPQGSGQLGGYTPYDQMDEADIMFAMLNVSGVVREIAQYRAEHGGYPEDQAA